eukprot:12417117-Karenia_brevis.AAC.1
MSALFANSVGLVNERQVYDVFFELCFVLAEHLPLNLRKHLQPYDVRHSLCGWIKVDNRYPSLPRE